MDTNTTIFVLIGTLAVGLGLGWLIWGREAANWKARHAERDIAATDLDERFRAAVADLGKAQIENERLRANSENFDKQIEAMKEAREELLTQFRDAGTQVLEAARQKFKEEAAERLGSSEKANKEAVANLLKPVSDRLQKYEEQVTWLERQRTDAFAKLHQQIETMRLGQEEVRKETQRLGNSLTNAPKARGRWGENQLRNVLEQCGLSQHADFALEQSFDGEEGKFRPDAVVRIPGGKILVIDSKVSLNAYQEAFDAENEKERDEALNMHVKSMRTHVQQLSSKQYQDQLEEAPDYVVMFVPGEHFVTAALEQEAKDRRRRARMGENDALLKQDDLWNFAFKQGVIIATPSNLIAIARTVAQVWRQDKMAKEAQEIGRMGGELHDRLRVAAEHMKRVGGGLETAVNNYNKFVGSFERNVLSSGRRLAEKGIEIGKREIEEVPLVESAPRYTASDTQGSPRLPGAGNDDDGGDAEAAE